MKKRGKWLLIVLTAFAVLWMGSVIRDRRQLNRDLIRLHVVADSDSHADQTEKLAVRDAVLKMLQPVMTGTSDAEMAEQRLTAHLDEIRDAANQCLIARGSQNRAEVTLEKEAFPIRYYDTFTLPAGVYRSLRITVGSGEGHNWWCVVFPALCEPATSDGFLQAAQAGGFSDSLIDSVTEEDVQIRFFFLDLLGRIENCFHRR